MIDINVQIHDKFSFELKTSFIASHQHVTKDIKEFGISAWIFVPNALDINRVTYSKEQFYKDTKSNVRLITPVFALKNICNADDCPAERLEKALQMLIANPADNCLFEDFTFQIRMFSSIFKSAARNRAFEIKSETNDDNLRPLIRDFIADCTGIKMRYRALWPRLKACADLPKDTAEYFSFGDMFIGNITEQYAYQLMCNIKNLPVYEELRPVLYNFVKSETDYKLTKGYPTLDPSDSTNNYLVVMRRNILKKFIESDLFLDTKKSKDGAWAEQLFYAIAAAVSMIFATIIAFTAQARYGNLTTPFFIALVISYAFKDRIKEIMRYYFSTQLDKRYFDTKRELEIMRQKIGWTKDSFGFVSESKVPEKVMTMRKRTPLVEAENKVYNEKIILYRKLVELSASKINQHKGYPFIGINDITRFNLANFVQKMDNASVPLYIPDEETGYFRFKGERVYALHLIIRCEGQESLYYRKFRLLLNREGIKEIVEISES